MNNALKICQAADEEEEITQGIRIRILLFIQMRLAYYSCPSSDQLFSECTSVQVNVVQVDGSF